MARKNAVKWRTDQFKELRFDKRVRDDLFARAQRIQAAAGGEAKGYLVRENTLRKNRAGFTIFATGHAGNSNRKHGTLLKALSRGG